MLGRRSKGLILVYRLSASCFQRGAAPQDALAASVQQAAAASAIGQCAQRSMSTGMWDVGCNQQRQELYLELSTARNLLPNRSNFFPQFTPHGVQLLPHRLPTGVKDLLAVPVDGDEDADEVQGEAEVLADSVKRKRKLKMKKHKYKKRMKKIRHQLS